MSLLQRGNATVKVYPEVTRTDADNNTITEASTEGTDYRAMVQPLAVASASTEGQAIGFESSSSYRMRLVGYPGVLGPRSQIEWGTDAQGRPARWGIDGPALIFDGSARTRHVDYTITRR
jgi:hypothetical protein